MKDLLADLTSGDDIRAENAIPALAALGVELIPALLEVVQSGGTDSRWWAVRALAASPHTQTGDLIPLLDDPASEVRAAVALGLSQHPGESAVPALIRALSDEDSLVAGLAGNTLVKIGGASVADLLKVMDQASLNVRIHALRALAEIRDHRAIPVMMKCMSEESTVLQYWAQEGLERLGLDMVYMKP
jgi:HEAT repeat protein